LEKCLGNNNKQLGRVGELMVCFELEKLGYNTSLVDAEGYDIVVNVLNKPLRLQVKSSSTTDKQSAKGGKPRYNFSTSVGRVKRKLTKEDTDIVALASIKQQRILFKNVSEITGPTTKISEAHFYEPNITKDSFEKCLNSEKII
jgi:hypothetical protein